MKNSLRNLIGMLPGSEMFVVTTALAALSHSTWTLSTLFSGLEPQPQFGGAWFAWVIPGLLIAVSFDVGMVSISNEIRNGDRSKTKFLALGVLSVSMFLLQWGYISHHMPALALAAGVRAEWQGIAALLRDSLLWVIPALLPIAVTLHTFSHNRISEPTATRTGSESTALALVPTADQERIVIEEPLSYEVECSVPGCDWEHAYSSARSAQMGKTAHMKKHGK